MFAMPFFLRPSAFIFFSLWIVHPFPELSSKEPSPHSEKAPAIQNQFLQKTEEEGSPLKNNCNILVWGGGYSPSGNQISLESNVKYFQRIKDTIGLKGYNTKTLFSDGADKGRDLQFYDPNFKLPPANLILAEIFGSTRGIFNQYRNNQLLADGSSSGKEIDQWINELNQTSNHSLNLIYFTGHGGKGDKKTPHNTTAYLWDNQKLKVDELSKKINQLPHEQKTVLIMVQCYSGGFANIIFKEGDPQKGLHDQPRAGFFSTVQDRVAAGCTPDIREENYQEYSTRFWEALCGESRTGKKSKAPDFNNDGKTSLLEAHSYVIINSNTIDIPVKTTDIFLRKFSSIKPPKDKNSSFFTRTVESVLKEFRLSITDKDSNASVDHLISKDWLYVENPIAQIKDVASEESNAIIEALSEKLGLEKPNRFKEAEQKINELKKKREELAKKKKEQENKRKQLKTKIKNRLKKEWPELANIHHPMVDFIKRKENVDKLVKLANIDKDWDEAQNLKKEISTFEEKMFQFEKQQVLAMRLKREIENTVLEVALPKLNAPDIVDRYNQLQKLERIILSVPKTWEN